MVNRKLLSGEEAFRLRLHLLINLMKDILLMIPNIIMLTGGCYLPRNINSMLLIGLGHYGNNLLNLNYVKGRIFLSLRMVAH